MLNSPRAPSRALGRIAGVDAVREVLREEQVEPQGGEGRFADMREGSGIVSITPVTVPASTLSITTARPSALSAP